MHQEIYQTPRHITNIEECRFYHTIEIPGFGLKEAPWDLRSTVDDYLGHFDFTNKRVLEVGCANGFLTFQMESRGAEVVAYDLSENDRWDVVPYARQRRVDVTHLDQYPEIRHWRQWSATRRKDLRRLNNAFWFAHRAMRSQARLVNGTVYDIPKAIGYVDVSTFGAILMHVRDPFLALYRALRLTRESVIVTEIDPGAGGVELPEPYGIFVPDPERGDPMDTWWRFSPELMARMVAVLGFEDTEINRFEHTHQGYPVAMYTLVGHRTAEIEALDTMEE